MRASNVSLILPSEIMGLRLGGFVDPVTWAHANFYIPETGAPIKLLPHQQSVLRYAFKRDAEGRFRFSTVVYATPKKSGKTTVAGLVGRWACETWGRYGEVLYVGNDANQAKERAFARHCESVELTPGFHRQRRELKGRWTLKDMEAICQTTGAKAKAVSTDYEGEAGANPILSVWTELWGFRLKADLRFWSELGPSPTRLNSIRWVETYAGYEGESELLWGLYEMGVKHGRRLTAGELGNLQAFAEAPNPDSLVPCWINEKARLFGYWDSGEVARRMPWQQGQHGAEYYAGEKATLIPNQFRRLHLNEWVSAESEFVPIELWDRLYAPMPLRPGETTPLVIALDAAVSQDSFGLVVASRHPDPSKARDHVAFRAAMCWEPPAGGTIDFAGPEVALRDLCARYNVVEVCYDPYQLHDFATRLAKDNVCWFRVFPQGEERLKADKLFYDLIIQKRLSHGGEVKLREHIQNCNSKQSRDEDTRFRLVKKSEPRRIDLAVCCSMAAAECLRLNI